MCNCISDVKNKIHEHLTQTLQPGKVKDTKLMGVCFMFSERGLISRTFNEVEYVVENKKKDGTYSNPKKQTTEITHTYCPFCGEKYEKYPEETEEEKKPD